MPAVNHSKTLNPSKLKNQLGKTIGPQQTNFSISSSSKQTKPTGAIKNVKTTIVNIAKPPPGVALTTSQLAKNYVTSTPKSKGNVLQSSITFNPARLMQSKSPPRMALNTSNHGSARGGTVGNSSIEKCSMDMKMSQFLMQTLPSQLQTQRINHRETGQNLLNSAQTDMRSARKTTGKVLGPKLTNFPLDQHASSPKPHTSTLQQ